MSRAASLLIRVSINALLFGAVALGIALLGASYLRGSTEDGP
jgi:hypothetical protein